MRQAEAQLAAAHSAVAARPPETYQWLLAPEQKNPMSPVERQALRLSGTEPLAVRGAKKLRSEESLLINLGPTILRKHLDEAPLWSGDHVAVQQLIEHFSSYLYLPRLAGPEVLTRAISDGVALPVWQADGFAYAESFDDTAGRYQGLQVGQPVTIVVEDSGLVMKPDVALRQLEKEETHTGGIFVDSGERLPPPDEVPRSEEGGEPPQPKRVGMRFYGSVRLDSECVGRDAGRIAKEVIERLAGQPDAEVEVTLEIVARLSSAASEHVIRTATENSRTLKFTSHGFEEE